MNVIRRIFLVDIFGAPIANSEELFRSTNLDITKLFETFIYLHQLASKPDEAVMTKINHVTTLPGNDGDKSSVFNSRPLKVPTVPTTK